MQSEIKPISRHYYDKEIIKEVGFPAAPLFEHIMYWVRHNEVNSINFHDGRFWMYNSQKSIQEQFDYLTIRQIEHSIKILADLGFVVVAHYGKDNTNWYSIGENGAKYYLRLVKEEERKKGFASDLEKFPGDNTSMWVHTSMCDDTTHQCGVMPHQCVVSDTSLKDKEKDRDFDTYKKKSCKKEVQSQPSFFDTDDDTFDTPIPTEKPKEPQKFIRITVPPCLTCEWDEGYQEAHANDPDYEKHWYEKWGKYFDGNNTVPREMVVLYDEKTGASYDEKMIPLNPAAFALEKGSQQSEDGQCFSTDPNTPISFEEFWTVYDLKTDKIKCRKLFDKLSKDDRIAIHQNLQAYVDSTPDKQFRKKPHRWLENRCWEDEIVSHDRFGRQPRDYTGL